MDLAFLGEDRFSAQDQTFFATWDLSVRSEMRSKVEPAMPKLSYLAAVLWRHLVPGSASCMIGLKVPQAICPLTLAFRGKHTTFHWGGGGAAGFGCWALRLANVGGRIFGSTETIFQVEVTGHVFGGEQVQRAEPVAKFANPWQKSECRKIWASPLGGK